MIAPAIVNRKTIVNRSISVRALHRAAGTSRPAESGIPPSTSPGPAPGPRRLGGLDPRPRPRGCISLAARASLLSHSCSNPALSLLQLVPQWQHQRPTAHAVTGPAFQ